MRVFMLYIGVKYRNSNIELHDICFSIGENAEACYADLRRQWWGDPESLHLDCWGPVEQVDGFDIALTTNHESVGGERLFFANMGGYDPKEFTELHRNILLIASDAGAAKQRALSLVQTWTLPHKDNLYEVENLLDLSTTVENYGYHLRITRASEVKEFAFSCNFLPIGRSAAP